MQTTLLPIPLGDLMAIHYDRRERLFDFVEGCSDDALADVRAQVLALLRHSLESEEYWVQHVLLRGPQPDAPDEDTPDLTSIRRLAGKVKARTTAALDGLSTADLAREMTHRWPEGGTGTFPIYRLVLQIVTHDVYHRGQILLLAAQRGLDIPDFDFL